MKVDVVFEVGKWYATVCYKVDRPPGPEPDMVAAMNRNCGQVAVVYSDGNPRYTGKPQSKVEHTGLKRAQRKQARLKKVSNRRHRTKLRIGKPAHRRIRNIGNTWRHRLTRAVASKTRPLGWRNSILRA